MDTEEAGPTHIRHPTPDGFTHNVPIDQVPAPSGKPTSDGKGAAGWTLDSITGVIQTVLAAQLVNSSLKLEPVAAADPRPETVQPRETPARPTPVVATTPKARIVIPDEDK